jgi:hypothetical protein
MNQYKCERKSRGEESSILAKKEESGKEKKVETKQNRVEKQKRCNPWPRNENPKEKGRSERKKREEEKKVTRRDREKEGGVKVSLEEKEYSCRDKEKREKEIAKKRCMFVYLYTCPLPLALIWDTMSHHLRAVSSSLMLSTVVSPGEHGIAARMRTFKRTKASMDSTVSSCMSTRTEMFVTSSMGT